MIGPGAGHVISYVISSHVPGRVIGHLAGLIIGDEGANVRIVHGGYASVLSIRRRRHSVRRASCAAASGSKAVRASRHSVERPHAPRDVLSRGSLVTTFLATRVASSSSPTLSLP